MPKPKKTSPDMLKIGDNWTLYLDRDGVINRRIPGDYVRNVGQFVFLDGAVAAITALSKVFRRVLVVTNQQGVGKGLMTKDNLDLVHQYLLKKVAQNGGRIDKIYSCTDLATQHPNNRKPNPGMALLSKQDFPTIDFSKSVMVGDSTSDMEFGLHLGMKTVFITTRKDISLNDLPRVDYSFATLEDFAKTMIRK